MYPKTHSPEWPFVDVCGKSGKEEYEITFFSFMIEVNAPKPEPNMIQTIGVSGIIVDIFSFIDL